MCCGVAGVCRVERLPKKGNFGVRLALKALIYDKSGYKKQEGTASSSLLFF